MNVLITGCSRGFGRAAALSLARAGQRVFATMRDPERGTELVATAAAERLDLSVHRLDVTDPASIDAALTEIDAPVDALVNNAGRGLRGPITTMSDTELHDLFDLNVYGVVRMVRACAPAMRDRGAGVIVNVSSMAGRVGVPFESGYCASKHAVEALSEAMRWELGAHGVSVVVIEPGAYATGFFDHSPGTARFGPDHPERATFEVFSTAIEKTMLGARLQDPAEVARAITDAVLHPDAGFRRLVGRDAEAVVGLHRSSPSYEAYERAVRDMFGLD